MTTQQEVTATDEEKAAVEEMKKSIGKGGDPVVNEVSGTDIRLFARAVGYTDAMYYDEEEAKKRGHRALPAPPGYTGRPIFNPTGGSGGGPGRDPLFPNGLNGGTEVEPIATIYAGDVLTAVGATISVELLPSRAYGRMVVRKSETTYTNQNGEVVAKTRGTGISY